MKTFSIIFISAITLLFISGCSAVHTNPQLDMEPPKYVEQMPSRQNKVNYANQGSLFGQGKNPLFADRKAMDEHDIVTVLIEEQANSSSSSQKNINKSNDTSLGGGVVTPGGAVSEPFAQTFNQIGNVGFETKTEKAFTGSGTNTRSEEFTTTISARIIKVLQNGNYFIQGSRQIMINGEKQIILLSGVIRPYDIDQYNQIDSKFISDAKILYTTEGELHEVTQKGWATEIIESVWPF